MTETVNWPLDQKVYKEALKHASKTKTYELWSKKDLSFLKKNVKVMTVKEIAKSLGRTENAVRSQVWAIKNGIRKDSKPKSISTSKSSTVWTKEEEKFLIENKGKLKNKEIAKALGRTEVAVKLRSSYIKNNKKAALKKEIKASNEQAKPKAKFKPTYKVDKAQAFLIGFTILNTMALAYILLSSFILK